MYSAVLNPKELNSLKLLNFKLMAPFLARFYLFYSLRDMYVNAFCKYIYCFQLLTDISKYFFKSLKSCPEAIAGLFLLKKRKKEKDGEGVFILLCKIESA